MTMTDRWCGPPQDRAAQRRQRIIDAARILFVQNGFHATGVAQIAKRSGIAVGQIYRDFEAKEDIVAMIVESDCAMFLGRESLDRAIAAGDSAAVWVWIRQFVEPTERSGTEPLFAEIVAESARNDRIAAIFARTHDEISTNIHAALALLAPGDHLASRRERLTDLILTQSLGLMQHRLLRPDLDATRTTEMIMAIVLDEIDDMRLAHGGEPSTAVIARTHLAY